MTSTFSNFPPVTTPKQRNRMSRNFYQVYTERMILKKQYHANEDNSTNIVQN